MNGCPFSRREEYTIPPRAARLPSIGRDFGGVVEMSQANNTSIIHIADMFDLILVTMAAISVSTYFSIEAKNSPIK